MQIKKFIQDCRWIPRIIQNISYIPWALVDPNGIWFLNLMFNNANIPSEYRYMFFPDNDWEIFIDCWMNIWLVSDVARKMGMEVYWFEPNPYIINILKKKYQNDNKVHLYPCAVWNEEWEMDFYSDPKQLFDQGASIIKEFAEIEWNERVKNSCKVKVKRLTDIIKNDILPKHGHIHMLKIDIEWAEFQVVNDIINEWLYKDITHIVVETHERWFKNWKEMLRDLKNQINKNNIKNIYLDWI